MLLRVEVFPHNTTSVENGVPRSPVEPMHVSLSTSQSEDGTFLSVGRKHGEGVDVVFSQDKSVSRQHIRLSLVSKTKGHHSQLKTKDGEVIAAAAAAPSTPDETEACAEHGMCVTLHELGSKFGTFIAVNRSEQKPEATDKADDDDETGDETEDEGDAAFSGIPLSSTATKLVSNPDKFVFKRLKSETPFVLNDLSIPDKSILIQCGQNGSLIRLTRVPLNIIFSKVDPSVKKLWTHRLYAIGASAGDSWDEMTYLVSNSLDAVAKQLGAWALKKPIVTTDYLQKLLDRNATDKLPSPDDYRARDESKKRSFWSMDPNPRLWSNCTLLQLAPSDIASLCIAAGAKPISLSGLTGKEFASKVDEVTQNEKGCFYIESTSRKVIKQVKELKQRGIPHVTQTIIAAGISEQTPLVDHEGNSIGQPLDQDSHGDDDASKAKADERSPQVLDASQASKPTEDSEEVRTQVEQPSQPRPGIDQSGEQNDMDKETAVPAKGVPQEEDSWIATKPSKKRKEVNATEQPSDETEKPVKRSKPSRAAEVEDDDEEQPRESGTTKRKRSQEDQDGPSLATKKTRSEDTENEETNEDHQGPRKKLATSADGWFVAAPSGSKRRSYRRPNEELIEELDGKKLLIAPTEKRSGLIVKASSSSGQSKAPSRANVVNYKRFRKNIVPRTGSMSRIHLRSVLPKESDMEHELEQQQRQLDEEKRIADALFNDGDGSRGRNFFKARGRKKRDV